MVVVYILAVIGGLTVIAGIGLILLILATPAQPEEYTTITCGLTNERCIFVSDRGTCNGCPIAEEAEKIGDR